MVPCGYFTLTAVKSALYRYSSSLCPVVRSWDKKISLLLYVADRRNSFHALLAPVPCRTPDCEFVITPINQLYPLYTEQHSMDLPPSYVWSSSRNDSLSRTTEKTKQPTFFLLSTWFHTPRHCSRLQKAQRKWTSGFVRLKPAVYANTGV